MESTAIEDPKDEQITNDDTAVTNKDGNNDLEKGKQPDVQDNPDEERLTDFTAYSDDCGDTSVHDPVDEDTSNMGQGPKGEDL
ncbi:MAG TPA: hypothetical protein VNW51_04010 [Mucilaginibacter sp.]|jgi:hypothetical protein|nr:hypothetical protein [Mucilaginibacter sp.]